MSNTDMENITQDAATETGAVQDTSAADTTAQNAVTPLNAAQDAAKNQLQVTRDVLTYQLVDERGIECGSFDINPTDTDLLKRAERVAENIGKLSFDCKKNASDEAVIAAINKFDEAVCEQFDVLLGEGTAERIFSHCGALTLLKNGDFYFEQILEKIFGVIEASFNQRVERKMKKARAATSKYHK